MTVLKQDLLTILALLPDRIDLDALIWQFRQIASKQDAKIETSQPVRSFLDAAQRYVGCIQDAPPDLATNPEYMEGYGA